MLFRSQVHSRGTHASLRVYAIRFRFYAEQQEEVWESADLRIRIAELTFWGQRANFCHRGSVYRADVDGYVPRNLMSQSPETTPASTDPQLDNLARLHRMSRTAGLGSTEYAAVNVAAVVTAVLGAASLLALVTPILLIIPLAGVVVGIIALRQLKASAGTQTGLIIAILGLTACVGFSAYTGYKTYAAIERDKNDKAQLSALVESLGQALAKGEYQRAYAMFDARFRDRVGFPQFEKFFVETAKPYVGSVVSMKSNGFFAIEAAADDVSIRRAMGTAIVQFEKNPGGQPLRVDVVFRYAADQWQLFDLSQWFPTEAPGAGQSPGLDPNAPAGPGM